MPALPIFMTLVASLGRGLAENLISNNAAKSWVGFAFDVIDQGVGVESNLRDAIAELELRQAEARERGETYNPGDAEFEAVWSRIKARDNAWDEIG